MAINHSPKPGFIVGRVSWFKKVVKDDSKTIWTVIFLLGGLLGYNVPEDLGNVIPTLPVSPQVLQNTQDIDNLNLRVTVLEEQSLKPSILNKANFKRPRILVK